MKAEKLRIGNLLHFNYVEFEVISINHDDLLAIAHEDPNYLPITLTEEWFVNFGFKIKNKKSFHNTPIYYIGDMDIDYCFSYADFRGDYGFYIEYTDSPIESDTDKQYPVSFGIRYVHQLQNLYFALTGEELIYGTKF